MLEGWNWSSSEESEEVRYQDRSPVLEFSPEAPEGQGWDYMYSSAEAAQILRVESSLEEFSDDSDEEILSPRALRLRLLDPVEEWTQSQSTQDRMIGNLLPHPFQREGESSALSGDSMREDSSNDQSMEEAQSIEDWPYISDLTDTEEVSDYDSAQDPEAQQEPPLMIIDLSDLEDEPDESYSGVQILSRLPGALGEYEALLEEIPDEDVLSLNQPIPDLPESDEQDWAPNTTPFVAPAISFEFEKMFFDQWLYQLNRMESDLWMLWNGYLENPEILVRLFVYKSEVYNIFYNIYDLLREQRGEPERVHRRFGPAQTVQIHPHEVKAVTEIRTQFHFTIRMYDDLYKGIKEGLKWVKYLSSKDEGLQVPKKNAENIGHIYWSLVDLSKWTRFDSLVRKNLGI